MSRTRTCLAALALTVIAASLLLWAMTLTRWAGFALIYAIRPHIADDTPSRFSLKTQRGALELGFHHYPRVADLFAAREGLLRARLEALNPPVSGLARRAYAAERRSLETDIAWNAAQQQRIKTTGLSTAPGSRENRWWPALKRLRQGENRDFAITIPFWLIALVAYALTASLMLPWFRTGTRQSKGLCPSCGYDLRATPGSCPECGHAVAQ